MKYKILKAEFGIYKFKIEEDLPEIGAYLYVFYNNECIKDYLQNSIDACKEVAFEEFGVLFENWRE